MFVYTDCYVCEAAGVPGAGAVWAVHMGRSAVMAGGRVSRLMAVLNRELLISGKTRRFASVERAFVCLGEPDFVSGGKGCGLPSIALLAS